MSQFPRHQGVVVPLITPVTENGQLCDASAERLVERVARCGHGLLLLGTTGEVASAPLSLRLRYTEIAVRVAARRVPVFACIAHNCLDDSIALARAHLKQGVDAVVGMLPNYFKLEPDEMRDYYTRLAAGTPGPLYLYNMPATTGMSLPMDVIEPLSHLPNVIGMKDSEATAGRREEVARRFGGRKDFSLFMGVASLSISAFRLGFDGCVPSGGNLTPELWRDLYAAVRTGDWQRAERLQQQADAINAVLQRNRTLGRSLAALKAALAERKVCDANMLPPLRSLSREEQSSLGAEISPLL